MVNYKKDCWQTHWKLYLHFPYLPIIVLASLMPFLALTWKVHILVNTTAQASFLRALFSWHKQTQKAGPGVKSTGCNEGGTVRENLEGVHRYDITGSKDHLEYRSPRILLMSRFKSTHEQVCGSGVVWWLARWTWRSMARRPVPAIVLFPWTRNLTPHCLSPPRCIKWVPATYYWG